MKQLPPVELAPVLTAAASNMRQGRTITAGNHITLTDAGAGSTMTVEWKPNWRKLAVLYSDMNAAADWSNYATLGSNVFTTAGANNDGNRVGVLDSSTSTSASGSAGIGSAAQDTVVFGAAVHRLTAVCKLPVLSDATQTYTVVIGFSDSRTTALPADGVFFSYTHGTNSGRWTAMSYSNSLSSTLFTDTAITADTAWHTYEIAVNAAATVALFYIDGALVATRSTAAGDSIPTGSARATAANVTIIKSVGTTSRSLYIDLLALEVDCAR